MKPIICPHCKIEINPEKKPKLPSDYDVYKSRNELKDIITVPLWKKIMYWYKEKHEKVEWNDKTWDKGLWGRNSREAVIIATMCDNDYKKWVYLVNEFTQNIIKKGLNWTLETISKHGNSILAAYDNSIVLQQHESIKNEKLSDEFKQFVGGHVRGIK